MQRIPRRLIIVLQALLTLFVSAWGCTAQAAIYTATDLGTFGGGRYDVSWASGINNVGQVVGDSITVGPPWSHDAFLYSNGAMTKLGTLGGNWSIAGGINAAGQIVGISSTATGAQHAFLYSNGVMTDLGAFAGNYSVAHAINASGQIVGDSYNTAAGNSRAFLYSNGIMTDLGTLGGSASGANGINAAGQVVGWSNTAAGIPHAFLYSNGVMIDLGALSSYAQMSYAQGINDIGQVVGYSGIASGGIHAFLFSNGVMTDLGALLGGNYSIAYGINSAGQVIGDFYTAAMAPHSFLYDNGVMTDLTTFPGGANYVSGINDVGQIVGRSNSFGGHAVLLTPVQPPVANAGLNQTISQGRRVFLSGTLSSDPRGLPLTYAWTIQSAPVGNTATLAGANTVAPSLIPNVAGTYVISLVVNDGQSSSAASTVTVNVTPNLPPNTVVRGIPTSGYAPLTVQFSAVGSTDPEGGPLTYSWSFGDGTTATNIAPAHIYVVPGSYTAAVTVTDDVGNAVNVPMVITVVPNPPPTIAPTVTPADGTAPLNVQFVAHAVDPDGDPLTVTWSFGDGSTAMGDATSHTYNKAGTYTATVTVSDSVNPPVSASLAVNVRFPLVISEAKVDFSEESKVNIDLEATFSHPDLPMSADMIKIGFGGISLLETAFANFKMGASGVYEYEQEDVHAKIDFNQHTINVSRHNIALTSLDNSNGINVVVVLGAATGTSNIIMQEKVEKHGESKEWTYTSSNNM